MLSVFDSYCHSLFVDAGSKWGTFVKIGQPPLPETFAETSAAVQGRPLGERPLTREKITLVAPVLKRVLSL